MKFMKFELLQNFVQSENIYVRVKFMKFEH
jgi:hypothetical protein